MNDTTKPSEYLGYWGEKYKNDLLTDILPFWLKYGIDHENGGYFTCLDRDGSLLDTNKSVWFQGRFAFILAYAYNNLEKQAEWLEACKNGIDFIEKYCFDTDGRMFYEVTKTGTPVRKRRYVFSETFAAIAMAQYSIAVQTDSLLQKHTGRIRAQIQRRIRCKRAFLLHDPDRYCRPHPGGSRRSCPDTSDRRVDSRTTS